MWDSVHRGENWDVVHAYGTSVEGWLVLVPRRHIESVADLTPVEATELGPLLVELSRAVQVVIGCDKTYVAQFAEHPDHRHVHFRVIARARDLDSEFVGPQVFTIANTLDDISETRRDEIAAALQSELRL